MAKRNIRSEFSCNQKHIGELKEIVNQYIELMEKSGYQLMNMQIIQSGSSEVMAVIFFKK